MSGSYFPSPPHRFAPTIVPAGAYGPLELWVYDRDGFKVTGSYFSGYAERIKDRGLAVSADGQIAVALTTDPYRYFTGSTRFLA